jgi:beta-lactamase class A
VTVQQQASQNTNPGSPTATPQRPTPSPTQTPVVDTQLQKQLTDIAGEVDGKVGVYAVEIESGRTIALNEKDHYPMQSVVKLPIAMTVLSMVDEGKLQLGQIVNVATDDMTSTNQRSPIRDQFPQGTQMTLEDLIKNAIVESDGTAADVLQRVAGGADAVQRHVESLGVYDMKIKYSHKEFGREWSFQYENWATPLATVDLLRRLWTNASLSKASADMLLRFMTESHNPDNRLLGLLPKGTLVAHKTGTGGTQGGMTSAINDVGIITLPNGKHVLIAVYIQDSTHKGTPAHETIAKIAAAVFEKWSGVKIEAANSNTNRKSH